MGSSFVAMFLIAPHIALINLVFLPILLVVIWYYQKFSSVIYRNMREKLSQLNTKFDFWDDDYSTISPKPGEW